MPIPNDVPTQRNFWLEHRIQTYIGSRYSINRAYYTSAYVQSAYSIEFSLKHLLHEHFNYDKSRINSLTIDDQANRNPKRITFIHELDHIYQKMVDENILQDILSKELLRKLTFESKRYPEEKINAYNIAISNNENMGPPLLQYLDSVFIKLDYVISLISPLNSTYIQALSSDAYRDNFFAYNINAYHYFDKYRLLGAQSSTPPVDLYHNENCDIKKDWEPVIPSIEDDPSKYDNLNFKLDNLKYQ